MKFGYEPKIQKQFQNASEPNPKDQRFFITVNLTYICADFIHSMRQFMSRRFVTIAKAFIAKGDFPALLTFESYSLDRCHFARNTLNIVNDILGFLNALQQCQHIGVIGEIDILILPQTRELILVESDDPWALEQR